MCDGVRVYVMCVYDVYACVLCYILLCMFEERDPYTHTQTRILYILYRLPQSVSISSPPSL